MAKGKLSKELRAYMAELGRRGGPKGARARAKALTPEERREIARKAARARWRAADKSR
jgi:hypothetical protein